MWFDFSYPQHDWGWSKGKGKDDWQSEKLMAMVRELQPGIIVNDRSRSAATHARRRSTSRAAMDCGTAAVVWEACQTLNGSWGYDRDNLDWQPVDMLVRMLVDTVSKGGNLLLNVGPNARGEFDPAIERLRGIGEWMRLHGRAIYGCTASELHPAARLPLTYNPDTHRLYLHLFGWPYKHVHLPGLGGRVAYAQFLHDASEIKMHVIDPFHPAST